MPSHTFKMEYLKSIYDRDHQATREEKSTILDEFCRTAHCHRKHAIRLLSGPKPSRKSIRVPTPRGRLFLYSTHALQVLESIWKATGFLYAPRLKAALPDWIPAARHRLAIDESTERQLLAISPRQIDRRLAHHKQRLKRRLYGTTKPGTLLKHMIPVRTDFWNINVPGFQELDLVSHSGPCASGDFIHTLNSVDILTTWSEQVAVMGKSQEVIVDGMRTIESRLPFPLRGVDSDNGSEFINDHLWTFCRRRPAYRKVQFTRSRPYKKNDNAHIEQKNGPQVRQLIGYDRYDTPRALRAMNDIYADLRILNNLFRPSMELIKKVRKGARIIRRHDVPRTAFQRVLECPQAIPERIQELRRTKESTDHFALAERVDKKLTALFTLASKPRPGLKTAPDPDHPWRRFSFSTKLKRRKTIFKKCNAPWLNKITQKEAGAR
jgi:hypothetical protein